MTTQPTNTHTPARRAQPRPRLTGNQEKLRQQYAAQIAAAASTQRLEKILDSLDRAWLARALPEACCEALLDELTARARVLETR